MFLYSDQCGGFCVCNIMSRMSGHVYPQSFMILNVFTIMFDLVHMQSQSFQMIFQSLMTSYQSVILSFSAQGTGFHLEMGLLFCVILLFNRGEPLSQFFWKCVFWLPLSNEGSHRCLRVFVFEIIAFKVFNFGPSEGAGPIRYLLSVSMYVCMYVCPCVQNRSFQNFPVVTTLVFS